MTCPLVPIWEKMGEVVKSIEQVDNLKALKLACCDCRCCALAETRQNVVFGEGGKRAAIFLLGEAPGAQEDQSGQVFIGRSGEVLNQILIQAGLNRLDQFITGSVKCRPPDNRNPRRAELAACRAILDKQLDLIRPRVVVCLGLVAVQNLLGFRGRLSDLRGRWFNGSHYQIMVTYHPAAVLRGTASAERLVEDFKAAALKAGSLPSSGY